MIPQEEGGHDADDNAAPLCPSCHETYGANPVKRKFIREARGFWYEVCEKRFASDKDQLERIASIASGSVTKDDLEKAVDRILGFYEMKAHIELADPETQAEYRSDIELLTALEELFDKV